MIDEQQELLNRVLFAHSFTIRTAAQVAARPDDDDDHGHDYDDGAGAGDLAASALYAAAGNDTMLDLILASHD